MQPVSSGPVYFCCSAAEVVEKLGKGQVAGRFRAADKHIVPPGMACLGQNRLGNLAQAAFRAVAGYGVTDLLGTGEPHANRPLSIPTLTGLQYKSGGCGALGAGGL